MTDDSTQQQRARPTTTAQAPSERLSARDVGLSTDTSHTREPPSPRFLEKSRTQLFTTKNTQHSSFPLLLVVPSPLLQPRPQAAARDPNNADDNTTLTPLLDDTHIHTQQTHTHTLSSSYHALTASRINACLQWFGEVAHGPPALAVVASAVSKQLDSRCQPSPGGVTKHLSS